MKQNCHPRNEKAFSPSRIQVSIRLIGVLLLFFCLQVQAKTVAQTVTLNEQNAPLEKLFKLIEKQSGYSFVYNKLLLQDAQPVTIQGTDMPLKKVLEICFANQSVTYRIDKNNIIVKQKVVETKQAELLTPIADTLSGISGFVLDEANMPLNGATITVKNSDVITSSAADGKFQIKKIGMGSTLTVSYVGYETLDFVASNNSINIIRLKVSNSKLDEVQVIAYGTTSKRFSPGHVTSIKSDVIQQQPVSNPLMALEGLAPGLFITQSNGLPGSGVTVRIQGQNSISYGNDPFYVIDGVPFIAQNLPTVGAGAILGSSGSSGLPAGNGNPLSYINPNDIESIEILKDADATAIYGSRAANGAILITTKKGKSGAIKTDISMQAGWGKVSKKLDLLSTHQYLEMRKEAIANDNLTIGTTDYDVNGFWDTTRYTDWQKELLGGTAHYTNVNATVSGGVGNTTYLVGGTYRKETTVFPGNFNDKKGSLHFSINSTSVNQKFKIQLTGSYLSDNNELPVVDLTAKALTLAPDAPALYNSDGTFNWALNAAGTSTWPSGIHPLAYLNNRFSSNSNNLIGNTVLSYKLLPGLEVKSSFGYTKLDIKEFNIQPSSAVAPANRTPSNRYAYSTNSSVSSWIAEPQISFKQSFGKGRLDILAGGTIQQRNSDGIYLYANGFNSDAAIKNIAGASTLLVASITNATYKYAALFSRFNYIYNEKYIVNFTARRDGTSRFGAENRFSNFGAIGTAWIFSQEKLIQKNFPLLSFGKLRFSYGSTGSDQIPDYLFLNVYRPISGIYTPYQGLTGITSTELPNSHLQWEETKKMEIGIDLGFVKDRIVLSANYIDNRSSNQLLSYALPSITGNGSITTNFPAKIQNKAWELAINATVVKSTHFNWNSNLNLTIPRNKLLDFPNLNTSSYASLLVLGQSLNVVTAYRGVGIDTATGVYLVADAQGKPTSNPSNPTDKTVYINRDPQWYGGWQNTFSYKGIELSFLLQFVQQKGADLFYENPAAPFSVPGTKNVNQVTAVMNRWRKPGDLANIQKFSTNFSMFQSNSNMGSSDIAYSNSLSFWRLRNASLSYTLPVKWTQKAHFQSTRFFVLGQNLFTISNYHGLDPETKSNTTLPTLRVITLGLQIVI